MRMLPMRLLTPNSYSPDPSTRVTKILETYFLHRNRLIHFGSIWQWIRGCNDNTDQAY
jgi:hypothetical protein